MFILTIFYYNFVRLSAAMLSTFKICKQGSVREKNNLQTRKNISNMEDNKMLFMNLFTVIMQIRLFQLFKMYYLFCHLKSAW